MPPHQIIIKVDINKFQNNMNNLQKNMFLLLQIITKIIKMPLKQYHQLIINTMEIKIHKILLPQIIKEIIKTLKTKVHLI